MKAIRYYGKQDVRYEDVPDPVLQPGTVKIKPAWCGICGSDLHLYFEGPIPPAPTDSQPHPLSGETLPVVFGHEFSGVVTEVADDVSGLSVGDHVVVEPFMVCGQCPACKAGMYNCCEKMGFIGISGRGGGLSEAIVVEQRWVHHIGDIPLDQAALIEPLSVAGHGVRLSGAKAGDVAVVGGAGPIGLLAAAVLKAIGVTTIVSEVSQARKDKALSSGVADYVVDPAKEDLHARVMELTGGAGADVALECAGVPVVFDALLDALRPGGRLQVIALFSHNPTLDMGSLLYLERNIGGTMGYCNDHERMIKLVQDGKIDLSQFITKRIKAQDIVRDGYEFLAANKDTQVKIIAEM
ncbi:2,3-butanediol dehydrogenase [Rarobacter incanus]|uniref:(R,R)-butanediol dehydrogenase/meso-butanediol dehydrogenase/diacetyl reductase n=1 Tax=Rarobacter incanus TaxID=153494 RepID=A0A542SP29_9MICO|nr:2,3-butanediol dehydrogenase [Rarobacter incanus]TQK76017.1 (R,R)-butanediol dehydrogenase/meso-butanediol dehydrogenase/diacetyl reductase [Rarobacter incanus]